MSEDNKSWTFKAEDIFEDIPDDPENVNMSLPPEVCEAVGLEPGDKIKILWGDQGTIIIEKLEETYGEEEAE
jgi:hypothetical protein